MEAGPIHTQLLRALAALLIANSHLEAFYPVRQLAADGLLGNSLFFLLSGYGLAMGSRDATKLRPFARWFLRRVSRIYPALFVVVTVGIVIPTGCWRTWSLADARYHLIWPTPYHFIAQITVFYLLDYPLLRVGRPAAFRLGWLALVPVYAGLWISGFDIQWLSWVFYFQMMLLGGDLARPTNRPGTHPWLAALALGIGLPVYVVTKAMLSVGRAGAVSFLPHALMFPIVWALLDLASWPPILEAVASRRWLAAPVGFLAGLTLEIYLVHDYVFQAPRVVGLGFPGNLLAFWAITLGLAWAVKQICATLAAIRPDSLRPRPSGANLPIR